MAKARRKTVDEGALPVPVAGPTRYDLAREELARIAAESGRVSPEDVVANARAESSPLHEFFTWDDDEAAEKFRLMQAGVLIRRIKITIIRPEPKAPEGIAVDRVRALQSPESERDTPKDKKGGSYLPSATIAKDPELRRALIRTVWRELAAVRKRYAEVAELQTVWDAIEEARPETE